MSCSGRSGELDRSGVGGSRFVRRSQPFEGAASGRRCSSAALRATAACRSALEPARHTSVPVHSTATSGGCATVFLGGIKYKGPENNRPKVGKIDMKIVENDIFHKCSRIRSSLLQKFRF